MKMNDDTRSYMLKNQGFYTALRVVADGGHRIGRDAQLELLRLVIKLWEQKERAR